MKKLFLYSCLVLFSTLWSYNVSYASTRQPIVNTEVKVSEADRAKLLNDRLVEIKDMDKSTMTRSEKKELRKEVKAIKEELAVLNDGIYLSVGAVVLIIILLIILL